MDDRVDDIRTRLQAISEDLGDLSMTVLRDAVEAGSTERPELDKIVAKARRSVDKAIHLLDGS